MKICMADNCFVVNPNARRNCYRCGEPFARVVKPEQHVCEPLENCLALIFPVKVVRLSFMGMLAALAAAPSTPFKKAYHFTLDCENDEWRDYVAAIEMFIRAVMPSERWVYTYGVPSSGVRLAVDVPEYCARADIISSLKSDGGVANAVFINRGKAPFYPPYERRFRAFYSKPDGVPNIKVLALWIKDGGSAMIKSFLADRHIFPKYKPELRDATHD